MQLDEALGHVEGLLLLVTAALERQDGAPPVEEAVEGLRSCMVAFSGLAQQFMPEDFTQASLQRMQVISQTVALQREHLVRLGAITTQQAQALVPQQRDAHTYGDVSAGGPLGSRASVSKLYHISG